MVTIGERADARANRARILCSARELLLEKGVSFDMRELAARATVGMGTLYRNVATKDELCAALLADILEDANAVIGRALAADDPVECVRLWLWGLLEFAERHGAVSRALQDDGYQMDQAEKDRFAARRVLVFQRALDAGVIRDGLDASSLADFTTGMFSAYLAVRRLRPQDEAMKLCMDIISHGIFRFAEPGHDESPKANRTSGLPEGTRENE
jgi:AcrR family transcriptional regulator